MKTILGQSVGKLILIILSFRVGTSKNEMILIIDVKYESDHISFIMWFNDVMCTKFLFCISFTVT